MKLLTIDHYLGPIEESERLARTWSPDDLTREETPVTKFRDDDFRQEVDFGNNVKLVFSEAGRVLASTGLDIVDEFAELTDEIDNSMNGMLSKTNPILFNMQKKSNEYLQSKTQFLQPKTDIGIAVRDLASELTLLIANEALLKKVKFFQGVPKHTQKFAQYMKNLSKSALRWGTAEAGAAFVARENEGEPFTLMLSDLTGITDENDLKYIRDTFQEGMRSDDSLKDLEVRMYQAMDGMILGTTFESVFAPLSSLYKIGKPLVNTIALGGAASIAPAEQLKIIQNLDLTNNTSTVNHNLTAAGFQD